MIRRKTIGTLLGCVLLAVPFLAYWAFNTGGRKCCLDFKPIPGTDIIPITSSTGNLDIVCLVGLVLYVVAWVALVRSQRGGACQSTVQRTSITKLRKAVCIATGSVLLAAPFLLYGIYYYVYEYECLFQYEQYRWLTDLGTHLRDICMLGMLPYAGAWLALARLCRGSRSPSSKSQ